MSAKSPLCFLNSDLHQWLRRATVVGIVCFITFVTVHDTLYLTFVNCTILGKFIPGMKLFF